MTSKEAVIGVIDSDEEVARLIVNAVGDRGFKSASVPLYKVMADFSRYIEFIDFYAPSVVVTEIDPIQSVDYAFKVLAYKKPEAHVFNCFEESFLRKYFTETEVLRLLPRPFQIDQMTDAVEKCYNFVSKRSR